MNYTKLERLTGIPRRVLEEPEEGFFKFEDSDVWEDFYPDMDPEEFEAQFDNVLQED